MLHVAVLNRAESNRADEPNPAKLNRMESPAARLLLSALVLPALAAITPAGLHAGQSFLNAAAETNVNQRYLIESVSVEGVEVTRLPENRIPSTLRERLRGLVGGHCDIGLLNLLASELRRDLHLRDVVERLSRGTAPDSVRVNFDLVQRDSGFDVSLPRLLYSSAGSFSGEADARVTFRHNNLTVGLVSNGDELLERFSGVSARLESSLQPLGLSNTRFNLRFEDYHEQWNATTALAAAPDLYRSRRNIAPELEFTVARPVTVSVGASFEQTQAETPGPALEPALNRSANAATLSVRYGHRTEGAGSRQQLSARYSLRVATRALGSSWSYARHMVSVRYEARIGRHTAADEVLAGAISGDAPLFDRFSLGSATTLRGWDRFAIDPAGGRAMIHNEFTYGYKLAGDRTLEGFYDTGSVWQQGTASGPAAGGVKHSLGIGLRQGIFVLTMAFPANAGRFEAVCMAGMNY